MSDVIPHEPSYTVDEFCKAERISRVALYAMWRSDRGPRFYLNGRCRRITHKARLDWQAEPQCDDKVSGPFSLNEAKATAINLAKGAAGDYRIRNAVTHLNGLQARLLDRECAK
jgi:hypothetical protein